jgi:peptidoglycan/xylan/chitin deacetylase (PgdA/CDA1 family)
MVAAAVTLLLLMWVPAIQAAEPVPDKLVVLTFDDAVQSHFTVVRPILLKYGFGATFFVTEGFDFPTNKDDYMTWEQIAQLHRDGFEIGNHTRDHLAITDDKVEQLADQLEGIARRCREHAIPPPTSFAWPGNATSVKALPILAAHGIRMARRGGKPECGYDRGRGVAYEPGLDHSLLIPSSGDARPDWELDDFIRSVTSARYGRIAVMQFHGVPDRAHPWVHTAPEQFELYMRYLAENGYRVVALRDLEKYVDLEGQPRDPLGPIEDRRKRLAAGLTLDNFRRPVGDEQLRFWLNNMLHHHRYSLVEASAATGLDVDTIAGAAEQLGLDRQAASAAAGLRVLPFPGGRHPRTGFRDGAIRPQRETKVSIFPPWENGGYVVLDVPEAIWWESPRGRELLYLAHTHVPTSWDREGIELEPREWHATASGWAMERRLPNQVTFGTQVTPAGERQVQVDMWIRNESEQTLRGLLVQNCVMLAAAPGFQTLTKDNKLIASPFVACHDEQRRRWIITAFEHCARPWANPPCPCMHSDPQFPDCEPGQTQRLRGHLTFYEGDDLDAELARLRRQGWQ